MTTPLTDKELDLSIELVQTRMALLRTQAQRDQLLHGQAEAQLRSLFAEQEARDAAMKPAEQKKPEAPASAPPATE
jgi:hypothetical protein